MCGCIVRKCERLNVASFRRGRSKKSKERCLDRIWHIFTLMEDEDEGGK